MLVFKYVKEKSGGETAFLASVILLTSKGFIGFHTARTGDTDSLLTMFVLLTNLSFLRYIDQESKKQLFLFFIFLTLAFAIKMYASLVFIPGYFCILLRKKSFISTLQTKEFVYGITCLVLVSASFIIFREIYSPGYIDNLISSEKVRVLSFKNQHYISWSYYLDNLIENKFSLWFIPLIIGMVNGIKNKKETNTNLSILVFSFFILISFSSTKLYWYDMPVYPYLSILAAYGIIVFLEKSQTKKPYFVIGIICMYPYWLMFRQSQENAIPSGESILEANEKFIFKRANNKSLPGSFTVYSANWPGSLLFYQYKLQNQGITMRISKNNNFKRNEIVLLSDDSLLNELRNCYTIKVLEEKDHAKLVKIINSKISDI
jgi:4-amino-4-deoxy-L-arabinose transferase-like glycosyltransferase